MSFISCNTCPLENPRPIWWGAGMFVISCLFLLPGYAQAQVTHFDIFKGSDKIGSIKVSRTGQGDRVVYDMNSLSEFQVVWKQVVRTSVNTVYTNGRVTSCHSSVRVNDSVRDSSNMFMRGAMAHCYVHPGDLTERDGIGDWTTARMYFEEPLDTPGIFVESVLQDCSIQSNGDNSYTLTFPNRSKNHYVYRDGELQEIRVERTFFDLVFRRV